MMKRTRMNKRPVTSLFFFLLAVLIATWIPVRTAYAQCEINAEVTEAETESTETQDNAITTIMTYLQNLVAAVLPVELVDLLYKIADTSNSLRSSAGDMWEDWEQNMMDETAQLNVGIIDQSRNILAGQDAMLHNDGALSDEVNEVEAMQATEINENSCTFDTVWPHMLQVTQNQRAVVNAATEMFNDELLSVSREVSPQILAAIYGPERERLQMTPIPDDDGIVKTAKAQTLGKSPLQRVNIEYDRYINMFCNVYENGGRAPCRENGSYVDDDIELSRTIFGDDTLRIVDMGDMVALLAAVDNLTGRPRVLPIPPSALDTATGKKGLLERRASVSHLNVSAGLIWTLIAERFPSEDEKEEIQDMRVAAGVPINETTKRPSKYETRQAFVEYVNSPPFLFGLKGEEKLAQSDLHLKAIRLMLINELNLKMEKMATLFSIQLANQLADKEGAE